MIRAEQETVIRRDREGMKYTKANRADPILRADPPPPGVWAVRCGVTCGRAEHPRVVLVAERERLASAWRCPACGEPAMALDPTRHRGGR